MLTGVDVAQRNLLKYPIIDSFFLSSPMPVTRQDHFAKAKGYRCVHPTASALCLYVYIG